MIQIFAFCNQKGGVGKTTSVINLAALVAEAGLKVLIIDMDAQANATSGLGQEKPELQFTTYQLLVDNIDPQSLIRKTDFVNLDLIPSSAELSGAELELINKEEREFALKKQMQKLQGNYDFVFIDCPPSLGLTTINALTASNYVIIPLQCEYYALEGLAQLIRTYQLIHEKLNPNLEIGGVILTMADFRTNLTQQVVEEVRNYFKDKVFNTIIPRSVKLSEAPSFGKPAVFYDPYNRGSKSYREISQEFIARFKPEQNATEQTPKENSNQISNPPNKEVVAEEKGQSS